MPYFQNVFDLQFRGAMLLDDRQYVIDFDVKPNINRSDLMISWNNDPYDLSVYNTFTLNFAIDPSFLNYATLNIDVAGATPSATEATEVAAALNADPTFSTFFSASSENVNSGLDYSLDQPPYRVVIRSSGRSKTGIKTYITNAGADQMLGFNKKAPVAELPTYYARHTVANRFNYPDSIAALVQLDQTNTVDQAVIANAGFSYPVGVTSSSPTVTTSNTAPFFVGDSVVVFDGTTTVNTTISSITPNVSLTLANNWTGSTENASLIDVHADWQLLRGRSGAFNFQKVTLDGSGRITQILSYSAGSGVGGLAKMTIYSYTGANTSPSQIAEVPYTLTAADLIVG